MSHPTHDRSRNDYYTLHILTNSVKALKPELQNVMTT